MQPLTDEIYAALKENERRQQQLVLINGHHRRAYAQPIRRISILTDY